MARQKAVVSFPMLHLVAAVVYAYDVKGSVVRNPFVGSNEDGSPIIQTTSVEEAKAALARDDLLANEDLLERASKVIDILQNHITMTLLCGHRVNEFYKSLFDRIQSQQAPTSALGIIQYLPKVAADIVKAEEQKASLANSASRHQGRPGEKIEVTLTVISNRYLNTYDSWAVMAQDSNSNLYSFWIRNEITSQTVKVRGKIRDHSQERNTGVPVTRLHYVKLIRS